ncbi:hypothetical protein, partial [Streptomyces sp. TP-A0356]|uniref:hypothetical protein n=1 Tax=Streptomyces sp. TP-A0356 TaxID=1359208 RepID=UPI001F1BAEC1
LTQFKEFVAKFRTADQKGAVKHLKRWRGYERKGKYTAGSSCIRSDAVEKNGACPRPGWREAGGGVSRSRVATGVATEATKEADDPVTAGHRPLYRG